MLITVQFPLADLRPFIGAETRRLVAPDWPVPRAGVDFIRTFGSVRDRLGGGVAEWPGEHVYCDVRRAVRFDKTFSIAAALKLAKRRCAFRRFFSDGEGVSRVEVGIAIRGNKAAGTLQDFLAVLHDALSLNVRIGTGAEAENAKLLQAARPLAKLILRATTKHGTDGFKPSPWWITACEPAVLVEYDAKSEPIALPPEFRKVPLPNAQGIDIAYGRMSFLGRAVGVWLVGVSAGQDVDYRRRLRIHLLRLHAQREVVKEVLRAINADRLKVVRTSPDDSPTHPSNKLQKFLSDTIEQMDRDQFGGVAQSELLEAAKAMQDSMTEGERTAILQRIAPLRRYVTTAVTKHMEPAAGSGSTIVYVEAGGTYKVEDKSQHINISGVTGNVQVNQVAAEHIENSFNQIRGSAAPEELKARLEELAKLVQQLVPKLPPDKQEETAKNLEELTKQATSDKPSKRWYEFSADGLLEAAKTVADMAAPVTTAVKAVLALLV